MGGLLCFVPDADTPGKKDASGAFWPSARAFARIQGYGPDLVVRRFPAHAPAATRRLRVIDHLRGVSGTPQSILAFFCHGYRFGLQAGFAAKERLIFAQLIARHTEKGAHVLLYCCSTGRDANDETVDDIAPGPGGDGGFADGLRDACELLGHPITVMAHTTKGHCDENPYARAFRPGEGGKGGHWYVEPQSELWPLWVRALKDRQSTLKYRFPLMTSAEIAAELRPKVS